MAFISPRVAGLPGIFAPPFSGSSRLRRVSVINSIGGFESAISFLSVLSGSSPLLFCLFDLFLEHCVRIPDDPRGFPFE